MFNSELVLIFETCTGMFIFYLALILRLVHWIPCSCFTDSLNFFTVQPNTALFEACCNEKIQQFDDSGSDEEVGANSRVVYC